MSIPTLVLPHLIPCDPELSLFLAASEHEISRGIDLNHWYIMQIYYWGDDVIMVESGSLIVLDVEYKFIAKGKVNCLCLVSFTE